MKPKTILILISTLVLLVFVFRACASYIKSKIGNSISKVMGSQGDFSFSNIDFSTGEFALIIDDKEPPVLINDALVLEANKHQIETEVSWINYLPGEGGGARGIRLYKNGKLVEANLARKFNTFRVGNLRNHGKPLELKSIYEPRAIYELQKDSLEQRKDVFIARATEVSAEGYEYRFTLECPSILVADTDSIFDDYEYGTAFAQRIKSGLAAFSGFKVNDNASNRSEPTPLLVLEKDGASHYLRNSETDRTLSLEGHTLRGAQLTFFCTKQFYEKIQTHDFEPSFIRVGLSENEIKDLIREKMGTDNADVTLEGVFESMFNTSFQISELDVQKYELLYFELVASQSEEFP